MSLESHVRELHRKHQVLDKNIAEEQRRPGSDDLEIAKMKREKLRLKEEIEKHEAGQSH